MTAWIATSIGFGLVCQVFGWIVADGLRALSVWRKEEQR